MKNRGVLRGIAETGLVQKKKAGALYILLLHTLHTAHTQQRQQQQKRRMEHGAAEERVVCDGQSSA